MVLFSIMEKIKMSYNPIRQDKRKYPIELKKDRSDRNEFDRKRICKVFKQI